MSDTENESRSIRVLIVDDQQLVRSGFAKLPVARFLVEQTLAPLRAEPGESWGERLAYVMYTSGSTGEPKGVILTHRNVASNVDASVRTIQIAPTDKLMGDPDVQRFYLGAGDEPKRVIDPLTRGEVLHLLATARNTSRSGIRCCSARCGRECGKASCWRCGGRMSISSAASCTCGAVSSVAC